MQDADGLHNKNRAGSQSGSSQISIFRWDAQKPASVHNKLLRDIAAALVPGVWGFLFISVAEKQPGFSNPLGWPGFAKPGETKQP